MTESEDERRLTILQVLSWLNYGGVESYAIRLSRALRERGHRVIVASSGGQLVGELEGSGIEHFQVDFTGSRVLPGMLSLRRLLEKEHVDLVNAHNWRAGMVSHLACKLAGVPYLLTVHGTRNPVSRHSVFYWSKRVVVVSEASRRNLVEGFGLPASRVHRSVIGVDCSRFRETPPDRELEAALGLGRGAKRIMHVSRFSHSKAPVALALISAMPELESALPETELVLVGQGPKQGAVQSAAEDMNRRLGRKAVVCLGGRSDISRLFSLASVVVATATVALEAMACGKPVVAAGKGGYLGPITPENLRKADETCFGDHVEVGPVTAKALARDLGRILSDPVAASNLGGAGRRVAEQHYSVKRLADEMESIYGEVLCERREVKRIVVFHLNQIGDLLFTLPALKALRAAFPEAHIASVLRPHLAGLLAESGFVDEIVSRPPGGPWGAVGLGWQLRRTRPDLAITFSQSATMALCARLSGARQRIGYVDSDLCRLLNHRVQRRGIPSPEKVMRLVRSLGLRPEKHDYVGLVHLSGADRETGEKKLSECGLEGAGPLIALAPGESAARPYKSWSTPGFRRLAQALATEDRARLVVVGAGTDREIGEQIVTGLASAACNLAGETTPSELAALLAKCDLLVGIDSGPMHLAAAMGRPVVGLFGPTNPWQTGPMGRGHEIVFHRQPCWPCMTPSCEGRPCMAGMGVDEVLAAVRRILSGDTGSVGNWRESKGEDAVEPPH